MIWPDVTLDAVNIRCWYCNGKSQPDLKDLFNEDFATDEILLESRRDLRERALSLDGLEYDGRHC